MNLQNQIKETLTISLEGELKIPSEEKGIIGEVVKKITSIRSRNEIKPLYDLVLDNFSTQVTNTLIKIVSSAAEKNLSSDTLLKSQKKRNIIEHKDIGTILGTYSSDYIEENREFVLFIENLKEYVRKDNGKEKNKILTNLENKEKKIHSFHIKYLNTIYTKR